MLAARTHLTRAVCAAGLLLHAVQVARAFEHARSVDHGSDFASYFYAARVAAAGEDPYDPEALSRQARREETRRHVHPFFYPPPFVMAMGWTRGLSLRSAYLVWFWLSELLGLAGALALWRAWRDLGPAVPVTLCVLLAAATPWTDNLRMGQANLAVLALIALAVLAQERAWHALGGIAIALAIVCKPWPLLIVGWWLLQRRWRMVAWAFAGAVASALASLAVVPLDHQLSFYARVVPSLARGDYPGLAVPIDIFGNHSLADLFDGLVAHDPAGGRRSLSRVAGVLTALAGTAGLALLAWRFRRPTDVLTRSAQVGALLVLGLVLPAMTYEHHLVVALPALVAAALQLVHRRLDRLWTPVVLFAALALCAELSLLREVHAELRAGAPAAAWLVRELKPLALLAVLAACAVAGGWRAPPATERASTAAQ